jgi:23S rRNA (uracil1939-C5)-methyltransferase
MARRHKRRPVPAGTFSATTEALAHDGRGVARVNGKSTFIHGALPEERVEFKYSELHSQYDAGVVETILEPSPERVTPRCPHVGICGGCVLQHLAPEKQILHKQEWLLENLERIGRITPHEILDPLTGPHWGYRYKARLSVKYVHRKERVLVGFRERATPFVADLERCEVLHPNVGNLLQPLAELIGALSIYNRLPQIEVALSDTQTALSFRVLDPPDEDDKARLIAFGQQHDIQIYLQPKGPETTYALWPENAVLHYGLSRYQLELKFLPYHFTQVNLSINRRMIDQAIALLDLQKTDNVLDLFCGLGNFTLPIARRAATVTGVEGDRSLVAWAGRNAADNAIANAGFFAFDLTAQVAAEPWMQQQYHKILLDPPRSGALEMMPHIATLNAQRIVYVSCHPATLARDAGELVNRYGYRLSSAGVMDMFPHTAHVESMALFER